MKREAIEALEARKLSMIGGFWANDGMNDDKGTREEALEKLETQFADAVEMIQSGNTQGRESDQFTDEDRENPFLAPAIQATREIETPRNDEGSVKDAVEDSDFAVDQD